MTPESGTSAEPVTVVVACFDSARWDATRCAVESVLAQGHPAVPIVVVDHNEDLFDAMSRWAPAEVEVLRNGHQRGASGARNTGVQVAGTELVAFLDDDATARAGWLDELVGPMADPGVVGVGGAILPAWQSGAAPRWFPAEFGWAVGATEVLGPEERRHVRNVWSGNMLVRREVFLRAGGFREDFGLLAASREPEDTELCLRMSAASGGGRWCLLGSARVDHQVPADRATRRAFLRRCWAEGSGKAALSRVAAGGTAALSAEQDYLTRTVPRALAARGRTASRGELVATDQAAMIVAGLAAAGAGFASHRLRRTAARLERRGAPRTPAAAPTSATG